MKKKKSKSTVNKARLEEMIEQATVDAHDESEQLSGWFNEFEENLKTPFLTKVLGVPVTVKQIDLTDNEQLVAVCVGGKEQQSIPILEMPLPTPLPPGAEWIEAYRHWSKGGL